MHNLATTIESTRTAAARAVGACKLYGAGHTAVRALDGVSVEFETGVFTAIMGPSGSGKSTLLHCLAGLDQLTAGKVYLGELDISELSEKELTRMRRDRVGFVFQAYNLVPTLTALENVTLPMSLARVKPDGEWLDTVIGTLGLRDRLEHRPSELSGGQQQRVAIGRALATRPDVIFADEPTGNLDSKSGAEVLDFMRLAVRDFGRTIVMVTHDPVAASHTDRVVFLADGRVVAGLDNPTPDAVLDQMRRIGS